MYKSLKINTPLDVSLAACRSLLFSEVALRRVEHPDNFGAQGDSNIDPSK